VSGFLLLMLFGDPSDGAAQQRNTALLIGNRFAHYVHPAHLGIGPDDSKLAFVRVALVQRWPRPIDVALAVLRVYQVYKLLAKRCRKRQIESEQTVSFQ
jgi:hypothetical protein